MALVGYPVLDQTFTLASGQSDLTGFQCVKLKDDVTRYDALEIEICGDATERPLGIAQVDQGQTVSAGKPVTVRMLGPSRAIASKAVSPRSEVKNTTNGMVTDAAAADTEYRVGFALTKTSQLFDDILIMVCPEQYNT